MTVKNPDTVIGLFLLRGVVSYRACVMTRGTQKGWGMGTWIDDTPRPATHGLALQKPNQCEQRGRGIGSKGSSKATTPDPGAGDLH